MNFIIMLEQSLIVVHLNNINIALLRLAEQMFAEEVCHFPEEIFVHCLETVTLSGKYKHLETLVGAYKSIYHTGGVCWVNVVVHISCYQQ